MSEISATSSIQLPTYQNTFKLFSDNPFNSHTVEKIIKEVLVEALENLSYDAQKVIEQTKWASAEIKARVKEEKYDRYKIVCLVTIGEKKSQDLYSIFCFLWDAERDTYAKSSHENLNLFATATCFGIYYE